MFQVPLFFKKKNCIFRLCNILTLPTLLVVHVIFSYCWYWWWIDSRYSGVIVRSVISVIFIVLLSANGVNRIYLFILHLFGDSEDYLKIYKFKSQNNVVATVCVDLNASQFYHSTCDKKNILLAILWCRDDSIDCVCLFVLESAA